MRENSKESGSSLRGQQSTEIIASIKVKEEYFRALEQRGVAVDPSDDKM